MGEEIYQLVIVWEIVSVVLFVGLLLCSLVTKMDRFFAQLRYINMEICRGSPRERRIWQRRRRRLYLSLLPFVRY